ncbi:MAG: hypothetical protein QF473_24480 [Planctomycetota bacterium]|jgi:hypothetical protein|nr:hypothetical protein [Planctomycetota bacterium]MDP6504643.1 hypothetical protein [Planctomycetota bacterium]
MNLKRNLVTVLKLAFVLCVPLSIFATVQPTLKERIKRADVVAIGYVRRYVEQLVVGHRVTVVTLRITKVLKPVAETSDKIRRRGVEFVYNEPIKGGINWSYFADSRAECLFFLRRTKNGALTVADPLFGVEKMRNSLRQQLEDLGLGATPTRWTRVAGVVLFFLVLNALFVAVVRLGRKQKREQEEENVEATLAAEDAETAKEEME